jgi:hypothetical protein
MRIDTKQASGAVKPGERFQQIAGLLAEVSERIGDVVVCGASEATHHVR